MASLAYILDRVRRRFPRTDRNLEDMLATDLPEQFRQLCSRYPFWFLSVYPSSYNLEQTYESVVEASGENAVESWIDKGWLRTSKYVTDYDFWVPAALETSATYDDPDESLLWVPAQVRKLEFVKMYERTGAVKADLPVVNMDKFYSFASFGMTTPGEPVMATLVRSPGGCALRLHPVPADTYILAVGFRLAVTPFYRESGDITTAAFQLYPELGINLGLLAAAEYFGELPAVQYYTQKLFGNPPKGTNMSMSASGGIVGDILKESRDQFSQSSPVVSTHTGIRAAVGRGGVTGNRSPRHGLYVY